LREIFGGVGVSVAMIALGLPCREFRSLQNNLD